MQSVEPKKSTSIPEWLLANVSRILVSLLIPALTFWVLIIGFKFLRDSDAPKVIIALVAIIWGVGGAVAMYVLANWLVEQLPADWTRRIQPFIFVGPAVAILFWYLALPTIRTFIISLYNRDGSEFVGLRNYYDIFFT